MGRTETQGEGLEKPIGIVMSNHENENNTSRNRAKNGCAWGCVGAILCTIVLLLVTIGSILSLVSTIEAFLNPDEPVEEGLESTAPMTPEWLLGTGSVDIVWIPLHGEIGGESDDDYDSDYALKAIRKARLQGSVKGIILELDTPGGGITASDILYHELQRFKAENSERKVVALFGDLVASGGYYVAMAADWIVAHPTSLTGSIGVIMQSYNLHELARKLGVEDVTIKSGANKDMLNPLRPVSAEQVRLLQAPVDALHKRFIQLVLDSRKIGEGELERWTDGQVFLADVAKNAGLIDQIGYREDAVDAMARLQGVAPEDLFVFRFEEPANWRNCLPSFLRPYALWGRQSLALKYLMP